MLNSKMKVLVVDDMRNMRRIVIKNLTEMGMTTISEADSGQSAWVLIEQAIAKNEPFQLIVSDWNMPLMKGIELLKKVRAIPSMKTVPFLLVTAETEMTQVSEAIKAGVSGYITKPFTPDIFKEKLLKIIDPGIVAA